MSQKKLHSLYHYILTIPSLSGALILLLTLTSKSLWSVASTPARCWETFILYFCWLAPLFRMHALQHAGLEISPFMMSQSAQTQKCLLSLVSALSLIFMLIPSCPHAFCCLFACLFLQEAFNRWQKYAIFCRLSSVRRCLDNSSCGPGDLKIDIT